MTPQQIATKAVMVTKSLTGRVENFEISTQLDYTKADKLRADIGEARERIAEDFHDSLSKAKESLDAARASFDAARSLYQKYDTPLETMEKGLLRQMSEYKNLERMEQRRIEDEKAAEIRRLEREKLEAERKAKQAATPVMKAALEKKVEALEQQAEVLEYTQTPEPIKVKNSGERTYVKWRVKDLKMVLAAALKGRVSITVESVKKDRLEMLLEYPDAPCPGIESYEEITVVRK